MEEIGLGISKFIPGAWARPCDTCKSTASLLYCPTHSLFLCIPCDSNIHAPPHFSHAPHAPPHERVWMCEVCEQAPAIVTCKADAAALCAACDRDIHSANPLARRHERVPVVPFTTAASAADSADGLRPAEDDVPFCSHDVTPSEWAFPNISTKIESDLPHAKCHGDFMFADTDQFLDFNGTGTDSVVPVQSMKTYEEATTQEIISQLSNKYVEIDFTNSKFNSVKHNHSFVPQTISQSISSSSMDVGVVPEGSSMSDISYPCIRPGGTKVDFTASINITASQGLDREARVMRYREKRKNRKFEKTIRYASRKAYAESRPRIKGRFAKRTETEPELMNQMFINSSASMTEPAGYGIVPSC